MMDQFLQAKPKARLFGLVRDPSGRPKIDDWDRTPEEVKKMLTHEERLSFEATSEGDVDQ